MIYMISYCSMIIYHTHITNYLYFYSFQLTLNGKPVELLLIPVSIGTGGGFLFGLLELLDFLTMPIVLLLISPISLLEISLLSSAKLTLIFKSLARLLRGSNYCYCYSYYET